ncbi:MAG TPA: hypothetical protein VF765_11565 [Polyangiaceae bacterium]
MMLLVLAACGIDTSGLAQPGDDSGAVGDDGSASMETGSMPPIDAGGMDVTMPAPDASDAAKDVASPMDASHDAIVLKEGGADGCVPTGPESCTNGVDDDCNGLTDCEDPACTGAGYTCVPDPSTAVGWSFAPLNPGARPACPSPLAAAYVDVNPTNLSNPASCSCTCGVGTQPDCEQGNITASYGNGNCNMAFTQAAGGGACHADNGGIGIDTYVAASTTPSGGTCTASVSQTIPPNSETHGETCSGETMFGAGCGAGQVCALVPAGFSACVIHAGALGCPGGAYTTGNAVGAVVDSRACTPCTCPSTPTAMCSGTWSYYPAANCGGSPLVLLADGQCHATGQTGGTYYSDKYVAAAANAMCGSPVAEPQPTGSATLTGQSTVCCN